jgi:outer membrane protein assembly factor BamB
MSWRSKAPDALLLAAIAMAGAAPSARADTIDPTMPRTLLVGAPAGHAPAERIDGRRSGRTRTKLPAAPVEAWRHHVTGGLEQAPAVDAQGNILVAGTVPELLALAPDGKELWRVRLGTAAPVAPPVITSDGGAVVITSAGQAWGVAPSGAVRFTTALGLRGRDIDVAPLALDDGGVVIASGAALVEIDRDGAVRARTALELKPGSPDGRVAGALLVGPRIAGAPLGTLFTTDSGSVYAWRPPASPRRLGTFGGFSRKGAVLADARTLLAVVDGRRVVAFDLPTGTTHVRAGVGLSQFDGPITLGEGDLAFVATQHGLLLGLDPAGNEKIRVALEMPPALALPAPAPGAAGPGGVVGNAPGGAGVGTLSLGPGGGSFFGAPDAKPSPPLLIDPDGRIAFARSSGRAGVLSPGSAPVLAGEHLCASPLAILPAGNKRLLIACRDGGLLLYGE